MMTLLELRQTAQEGAQEELAAQAQIIQLKQERTKGGKPYFDLELADATARTRLKIWADSEAFGFLESASMGDGVELTGFFHVNDYGLNVNRPVLRALDAEEKELLFVGSPERKEKSDQDWQFLKETFSSLKDARLRLATLAALEKYEKKWRRAGAARTYHHARRGGLLEHTAQMLRCAAALAPLYPEIFPDLLYAGVLFHDIGKLWENDYEEAGFVSPYSRTGEMMGHICIGVELVNQLWKEAKEGNADLFETAHPPSDLVRDHLLHLIVSHHGQMEFGAPVTPRTPEAWMLHYIDNLDATTEMLRCTYAEKQQASPGLFEARRPLTGLAVLPLSRF
ncbi:MAG: HD domain-containing protein [bacterium]